MAEADAELLAARDRRAKVEQRRTDAQVLREQTALLLASASVDAALVATLETLRAEALGEHQLSVESCDNREQDVRGWLQTRIDNETKALNRLAEKIIKEVSASYHIEHHELNVTASLGIAMYPTDGDSYEALSMCADTAMYRAKQGGRNTFRFFTREMQERSDRTLQLENALRRALELDQLELHYQPQISLADGCVIGV